MKSKPVYAEAYSKWVKRNTVWQRGRKSTLPSWHSSSKRGWKCSYKTCNVTWGCFSSLLSRRPKLPALCCLNGPGNSGNLGSNKEIHPDITTTNMMLHCCKRGPDRWQVKVSINIKGLNGDLQSNASVKEKLLEEQTTQVMPLPAQ